ncbi:EAL domain-containing protein [Streptomyces sp. DSM 42041]|uniref:EAL domain-containing protein n=1 Tax=Streptomyces hazeniae TaxID=3075538 RepID=A0ABU2NY79_9ACTN|nr:EAL domain-containing protein [Streptomyces sp. DSM 42041]MDT0381576.1 EAL domain-containing protein [Streptomyces sp. DSM 42041]
MNPAPQLKGTAADGLRRFATIWSRAVYPATATSMTRAEFEDYLHPLAVRLGDALHAHPFTPAPGREVGEALVAAHCTAPDALPQILGVVESYLVLYSAADTPLPVEEGRARCSRLQHAVAAGFAKALRERTRSEQEALSRAALAAQAAVEEALHTSETRFRTVFKDATIGIGIADMDGRIRDVNGALARMFNCSEDELRRRNVSEWVHPSDAPEVWRMHRELVRGERDHFRVEKPYHRPDGTVLWTNLTVSLLRGAEGEPRYQLALMEDITERRLLHLRLRYEATHDELTGLPNRTLFAERLERVLAGTGPTGRGDESRSGRFGLLYLDIDGFKAVNDSLGHAVGDQLLVSVAERLQSCAAAPNHLVGRIGGDEFVALISNPSGREEVTELARQALAALATPITVDGRDLSVRASIGIVEGSSGELGPAEVLRSADITMYRAKDSGGNRYEIADPVSDARAIDRHSLTNHLPGALERGEFFLEYQPLIRMSDSRLTGAEALVRWRHPVHGLLGPDRFIPLAEHTGLIVPLGRWVLEQAVRQACDWCAHPLLGGRAADSEPIRVNVNLSPRQLHHPDLVQDTVAVLEWAGLTPASLCLEVTESALIGADEDELKPLRQLAEMGVDIALDDFGTGYSNLANLRRLPATTLKLDRSFTQGLQQHPADPVDVTFVGGIVSLAHALGLRVTVEGVETEAQAAQLRELGCDTAQGWYYARPAPAEEIVAHWATA